MATGWDSWPSLVEWIEEVVEPHYVEDPYSEDTGINFSVSPEGVGQGQGVYLDYPFTLSEFWREVHEADDWATKQFFDMVRDEQFTEFAASAREADGVVAVEMKDLYNAADDGYWQLRPEKITKKQLSFIRKTLRTYGLAAAWLPAAPKAWALLYLRKSPIAREIREHLVHGSE